MAKLIQEHFHRMQLAKAKKFIRSQLSEKLSLDELAKASGASSYHFIRIFAAYTGETPFAYIRRERVVKSLKLLEENLNVTDVAQAVGFETPSSFNKAFKKETEMSPSEYRNLGKAMRYDLLNNLQMGPKAKEIIMNINMELKPEIITRQKTVIYGQHASKASMRDAAQIALKKSLKKAKNFYKISTNYKREDIIYQVGRPSSIYFNGDYKYELVAKEGAIVVCKDVRIVFKDDYVKGILDITNAQTQSQCDRIAYGRSENLKRQNFNFLFQSPPANGGMDPSQMQPPPMMHHQI